MKKFAKLVAVFAALMLAWACFVACSNGDDDNGPDDASVKALQGLWIEEGYDWGFYFVGDTVYEALFDKKAEKYYYCEDGDKFSVSGTKIIMYYYDEEDNECEEEGYFETNGDTLTLKYEYKDEDDSLKTETETYKKNTEKPLPLSSEDFNKLGDSLFAD